MTKENRTPSGRPRRAPVYRLVTLHRQECCTVRDTISGRVYAPWTLAGLEGPSTVLLNAWGTSPGWHPWLRLRCNDTRCPAVVIIKMDEVGAIARFMPALRESP